MQHKINADLLFVNSGYYPKCIETFRTIAIFKQHTISF